MRDLNRMTKRYPRELSQMMVNVDFYEKSIEVTRLPFEAELEDGRTVIVKRPKKKRRAPVKETSSW